MFPFDAVLLAGPTASGKTSAALQLTETMPIEIISMDSALVYRGMDIGTAKPTTEELGIAPHHLIDILDPEDNFSAARFVEETERLIPEIHARGRLPVIVGGTMLYAKALLEGFSTVPSSTKEVRELVAGQLEKDGLAKLYERLKSVDAVTAARLKPGDTQRISRALEVWELTGKPFSSFMGEKKGTSKKILEIGLMPSDRKVLHERIAKRFDVMLAEGFLDEVKRLRARPNLTLNSPSMRCVGYRQVWMYLDGTYTEEEFREAGIAATRQLAKRQITWMRSMPTLNLIDPLTQNVQSELIKLIQASKVEK